MMHISKYYQVCMLWRCTYRIRPSLSTSIKCCSLIQYSFILSIERNAHVEWYPSSIPLLILAPWYMFASAHTGGLVYPYFNTHPRPPYKQFDVYSAITPCIRSPGVSLVRPGGSMQVPRDGMSKGPIFIRTENPGRWRELQTADLTKINRSSHVGPWRADSQITHLALTIAPLIVHGPALARVEV